MEHDDELMQLVEEELQAFEHVGDWWFPPSLWSPRHDRFESLHVVTNVTKDEQVPSHGKDPLHQQQHQHDAHDRATKKPKLITFERDSPSSVCGSMGGAAHGELDPRKRRRRPRMELLELRHQTQMLQKRLDQLQQRQLLKQGALTSCSSSPSSPTSPMLSSKVVGMAWRSFAEREQDERQLSEKNNNQLKQWLAAQVHQARAMRRHVMLKRQECDMACWVANDPMIARAALVLNSSPSNKKKSRVHRMGPLSKRHQQEEDETEENQAMAEARLWLLLQRLDFVWQQLDLVFRKHALSLQLDATTTSSRCHQLKIRCALNEEPAVLFEDGFVELVGSTVTCFDAKTLEEILWKCFIWESTRQSVIQPVDSSGQPTVFIPVLNSKKIRQQQRIETSDSRTMSLKTGSLVDAIDSRVVDDVVHGRAHFVIALGPSRSEKHNQAQIEAQGALKRLERGFVCETFGRVELDNVTQIAFNRSEWFRIEALEDGRSVIHHVHRVRPLIPKTSSAAQPSVPAADPSSQKPPQQQPTSHHLQLFAELLQRTHGDMWTQFRSLILEEFAEKLAKFHKKMETGTAAGWPFEGAI